MSDSKIEWTEQSWNPVTGCTKVSPGCKFCYAEVMAQRLQAMGAAGYARGFALTLHEERLHQPLRRKKPTVYFVNSMSDLFHEDVPDAFIERVMTVAQRTPQHTYQILTKRADRLPRFFGQRPVPANVWLGCRWKTAATAYHASTTCARSPPAFAFYRSNRCWNMTRRTLYEAIPVLDSEQPTNQSGWYRASQTSMTIERCWKWIQTARFISIFRKICVPCSTSRIFGFRTYFRRLE